MSLPQFPELPGSKTLEVVLHSAAFGLREKESCARKRSERFDQRGAVRIPRRIEAMGFGQIVQDRVGQRGKGFAGGRGRSLASVRINRPERDKRYGHRSCIRWPIPAQDFDGPLDLSELARIAARVGVVTAGPIAVCLLHGGA